MTGTAVAAQAPALAHRPASVQKAVSQKAVSQKAVSQKAVSLKAVLTLSATSTVTGRKVTASVRKSTVPKGDKLTKITLSWGDGSKVVTLGGLKSTTTHRYAKAGTFKVRLTLTDKHKKKVSATVTEHVKAAPPASPGSYSGTTEQGYGATFYVSSDGTSLQDIAIPTVYLTCTPGGAEPATELTIASAPIGSGGSFTGSATENGVFEGNAAKFSFTFKGSFSGTSAAGTFKVTLTYNNGTAYTCTTNTLSWSATRDTQPTQTAKAPPAGSYSGSTWQGYGVSFYVSSGGTSLQDIAIPTVYLDCMPGNAEPGTELTIASASIGSDGSFTGTASEPTAVWEGFPATVSFSFRGNFHSLNPSGVERAAGTFQVTVAYTDGSAYTCTTNPMTWSATRDTQPSQTTAAPPAGTYSGSTWQGYGLTFSVSSDQTTMQDITIPTVYLDCTPGNTEPAAELTIPSESIGSDGSFSGTVTDTGVFESEPATFTYTFRGNFHSLNASGVERAAGTFEVTVTYTNGSAFTCSSNQQSWKATFSST
jgi:PKD domain